MARFYLPPSALRGTTFILSGTEAHHALHVLRKKTGDEIDLFDGKDASYKGRIDSIDSQEIRGTILNNTAAPSCVVELTLFQALTKATKWEWLLEKACEIGVSRVVPVMTRRSLIKLDPSGAQEKVKRWNRIALAASKQCGRANLMSVEVPEPFSSVIGRLSSEQLSLIPWEKETQRSIQSACAAYKGKQINVFIGPEGGWDAAEIDLAERSHVIPVRLGPTLLRTETAGLVAVTLVLREFGVY
jgi:16S rRNA (uracil1498-N3)-methyltransferase